MITTAAKIEFPRYESYRDSGVDWLGEIPSHWELSRLQYQMKLTNGYAFKPSDWGHEGIPIVRIQNLNGSEDFNRISPRKRIPAKYILKHGDIVFSWSGNVGTSFGAFLWEHENEAYLNQHIFKVHRYKNYHREFVYWLLRAVTAEVESNTHGIFGLVHITKGELGKTTLPVIPLDEQQRIANFLDEKTAEIDEAISKKQRLIALLKEQKAILINQAVCKGINPNAPLKDSHIPWIGQIPKHWEVKRNKFVFKEVDERSTDGTEELLSVSHMTGVTPRSEKQNVHMFMAEDYTGSKLCTEGDLVINTMWAWMGALGVSGQLGIISPSYGVYRTRDKNTFNSWYLENLLRSPQYVAQYNRISTGLHSSRLRLYPDMFLGMEISIPPKEEQDEIESSTRLRCETMDLAMEAANREIQAMKELKQVLISKAVTGKIKI
ncbi:restriction endonuclease subunit S [Pelagicoccus enzymogenes]|uniref:restriction endonuclease subunit S n=1 Tax=Pelagicoccus enzymogenes TaxID=2773457 RepID=UPI00280D6514|nr:restriction endonuclease subunit S [Pelagicoccus enzymogenes]MDQ8198191.1 restriction endonuclease subunit S [Pelagicoccus enzymogenes]